MLLFTSRKENEMHHTKPEIMRLILQEFLAHSADLSQATEAMNKPPEANDFYNGRDRRYDALRFTAARTAAVARLLAQAEKALY